MHRFVLTSAGLLTALALGACTLTPGDTGETDGGDTGGATSSESAPTSSEPGSGPGRELSCTDGRDNEGDGLLDCDDPDCASDQTCRCSALSCGVAGDPRSEHSCIPQEGCFCNTQGGCSVCRQEDQTCGSSNDCCFGLGLTCQEVTLASGTRESRCLPTEVSVCNIECRANGTWGSPSGCRNEVPPSETEDCAVLTGVCDVSQMEGRSTRKCWQS